MSPSTQSTQCFPKKLKRNQGDLPVSLKPPALAAQTGRASNEYRMSARGEAAHARAMPCLRFFLTLLARPFVLRGFAFIYDKLSETIRSTSETDASPGLNSKEEKR